MKHIAKIQEEFVKKALNKEAAKWDDLSYEAQKKYLSAHPASKRKMTAKPGQGGADLHELIEEKKESLGGNIPLDKIKKLKPTKSISFDYNGTKVTVKQTVFGDSPYELKIGNLAQPQIDISDMEGEITKLMNDKAFKPAKPDDIDENKLDEDEAEDIAFALDDGPESSPDDIKKANPEIFKTTREVFDEWRKNGLELVSDEDDPETFEAEFDKDTIDKYYMNDKYIGHKIGDDSSPVNPSSSMQLYDRKTGKEVGYAEM